jgi:hypothetical protein
MKEDIDLGLAGGRHHRDLIPQKFVRRGYDSLLNVGIVTILADVLSIVVEEDILMSAV